jgi:uncharacterized protein (TIGR03545 family)
MKRPKLFRWRAIVPLGVMIALMGLVWWLLLDRIVELGIEETGAYLVGARVDLERADVRLRDGTVALRGLQVTNPNAPMQNLFEAEEIVADVRWRPLLEQKVAVDTVAVRGMRFGTPRQESGELENPSPQSGMVAREVAAWAEAVRVPPFSLEGLGRVVDVAALDPDSLRTVGEARALAARAGAVRATWDQALAALDPQPHIDSARALVQRLEDTDVRGLDIIRATRLAGEVRQTLFDLGTLGEGVEVLSRTAQANLGDVQGGLGALVVARQADYAYARGLLELPSLDAPDLSPAIFGDAAVAWVEPVLYWLRLAEQYLPPGIDPRRYRGPDRPRRAGTTVEFPDAVSGPRFVLEFAELGLELAGEGMAAGAYLARVTGLTSDPALYGKPLEFVARRSDAAVGPSDVSVRALLNHVAAPVVDSLDVGLAGIELPSLDLDVLGARLVMGRGTTDLQLARTGDVLSARWSWHAPRATWERLAGPDGGDRGARAAQIGTREWAEELLWRTVSGLRDVRIEVGLSGAVQEPVLTVRSNVGQVVAGNLQRELGQEVERAERRARAQVDALVNDELGRARRSVNGLEAQYREEIEGALVALAAVREELEQEVERLGGRLPGGLRIP